MQASGLIVARGVSGRTAGIARKCAKGELGRAQLAWAFAPSVTATSVCPSVDESV